ncbi:SDR family oxidoreductase [Halobacillus karajensis]|uniref:Sugar epimerase YhfK n=1 Tax=Halobacillus karajensis TaxID=195088 RepID=A0A024P3P6_9BACI|nr:SDR family oxidoreductase [Halobacillus karajensis]CDQ18664.1 putative sugar epimerase YhfK [Halobacillus karajensis]CDQ23264.1 putative sugar epimerase YhfK [Halobacillus karajensis]CDQ26746.1 putative sugar epimerase YhfK [Halobacillus karajensis]
MKVLVAGANGHTGRLLIQYLKEDGHEPYGLIRKEDQKAIIENLGGTPVLADLTKDVGYAVKGMDAVMFAAGSGSRTGPEQTEAVDRDGAINLAKATENLGIKKFVMLSGMAAGEPERGPEELKHYLEMKGEADEFLKNTELDYTIVRPGGLTHEDGTSKIKVGQSLERGTIPRADVAKTMIAVLQEPNAYHKTFEMISGDTQIEDALRTLS